MGKADSAGERVTPQRLLHFVRHGQYDSGNAGTGLLTALGEKQARAVAAYLAELPIARLASSDWPRARQTADLIAEQLPSARCQRQRALREIIPTSVPGLRVPATKQAEGKRRVELVLERFFKPARQTRHEVFVCHGNLIRALVLRACAGRVNGWERLPVHHCGITTFSVSSSGVRLECLDQLGHLPVKLQSA